MQRVRKDPQWLLVPEFCSPKVSPKCSPNTGKAVAFPSEFTPWFLSTLVQLRSGQPERVARALREGGPKDGIPGKKLWAESPLGGGAIFRQSQEPGLGDLWPWP